jgi:hypothetical protein
MTTIVTAMARNPWMSGRNDVFLLLVTNPGGAWRIAAASLLTRFLSSCGLVVVWPLRIPVLPANL